MECPSYIGRPEAYSVGTVVRYNGSCFEAVRDGGNGWIDPINTWFWSSVNCVICSDISSSSNYSSSYLSSSSVGFSSSNNDFEYQVETLTQSIDFLVVVILFAVGVTLGKLTFDQIKI